MFFKVTVGRYYTASGKSTQIEGVKADIVVPSHYAPYKIGEMYLEYPLPADQVDPAFVDPLTDLDEKTRKLFQMRYLPFTQRVVSFWKKRLPALKEHSAQRLASDPAFREFLQKQEVIKARAAALPANTVDEQIQMGMDDIQMKEAVNIVKDMIIFEAQGNLLRTGSDD
jgi:carboxyl-terminal processing protease